MFQDQGVRRAQRGGPPCPYYYCYYGTSIIFLLLLLLLLSLLFVVVVDVHVVVVAIAISITIIIVNVMYVIANHDRLFIILVEVDNGAIAINDGIISIIVLSLPF